MATEAEPDRPYWWTQLSLELLKADQLSEAEGALTNAAELQPNNAELARQHVLLADERRLEAAIERICEFGRPECELNAADLLANSEGDADAGG
jgi:hypothetical protein